MLWCMKHPLLRIWTWRMTCRHPSPLPFPSDFPLQESSDPLQVRPPTHSRFNYAKRGLIHSTWCERWRENAFLAICVPLVIENSLYLGEWGEISQSNNSVHSLFQTQQVMHIVIEINRISTIHGTSTLTSVSNLIKANLKKKPADDASDTLVVVSNPSDINIPKGLKSLLGESCLTTNINREFARWGMASVSSAHIVVLHLETEGSHARHVPNHWKVRSHKTINLNNNLYCCSSVRLPPTLIPRLLRRQQFAHFQLTPSHWAIFQALEPKKNSPRPNLYKSTPRLVNVSQISCNSICDIGILVGLSNGRRGLTWIRAGLANTAEGSKKRQRRGNPSQGSKG